LETLDRFLDQVPGFLKDSGLDEKQLEAAIAVGPQEGISDSDLEHLKDVLEAVRLIRGAYAGRSALHRAERASAQRAEKEDAKG